jgi:hypothetical protein
MFDQLRSCLGGLAIVAIASAAQAQSVAPSPLRVLLIVDSSSSVAPMLNSFRSGLSAFMSSLPPETEVAMVTTGGQLRVRLTPTMDRAKWLEQATGFTQDGGANSLLETLLEADRRFLRNMPNRRPEIVIITTDGNESRDDGRLDAYNSFVREFISRGGRAHGIVIRGTRNNGLATEVVMNLTRNTDGFYGSIVIATALREKIKGLAEAVAADGP